MAIQHGVRFDEMEGTSLVQLPNELRTATASSGTERVALPICANYVTLEGK